MPTNIMAETVTIPVRPPTPQVAPLEPRLTAIQERMARLSEKDGGVLVGGPFPTEAAPPVADVAVESVVAEQPESDGRIESSPEDPENQAELVSIREWLGPDSNPNTARARLEKIANRTSTDLLRGQRRREAERIRMEVAAGRMTKDRGNVKLASIDKTIQIKGQENRKIEKILTESQDPRDRAFTADFDIHLARRDLKELERQRTEGQTKGVDVTDLESLIAGRTKALEEQTQARAGIKDEAGNPIPDQVVQGVKVALQEGKIETIIDRSLTAEEIALLDTEPLVVFERMISFVNHGEPARVRANLTALGTNMVQSGFLTSEQAGEFTNHISTELTSKKTGSDKLRSFGMGVGGLFLAMAWAAKQREGAGQAQQG